MPAKSLLTIPKEIRLRILDLAAEDVWPSLSVKVNKPASCRFGFWEIISWPEDSTSPVIDENKDSGLSSTCHILRDEFLEVLGATHELDLLSYKRLMEFAAYRPGDGGASVAEPALKVAIPPSYATHVQQVRLRGRASQDMGRWPYSDYSVLFDTFPGLKKLSAYTESNYQFRQNFGDYHWTLEGLEAFVASRAFQTKMEEEHDKIMERLKTGSDDHTVFDVGFDVGYVSLYNRGGAPSGFNMVDGPILVGSVAGSVNGAKVVKMRPSDICRELEKHLPSSEEPWVIFHFH